MSLNFWPKWQKSPILAYFDNSAQPLINLLQVLFQPYQSSCMANIGKIAKYLVKLGYH